MNELTEITKSISDPQNLKNDMAEAVALVSKHFRQKYLAPVKGVYAQRRADCMEKPSPQVALLQACRPFVKNTDMLDRVIDGVTSCNAAARMWNEYRGKRSENRERQNDVVYTDHDTESKSGNSNDIMFMLVMLMAMKR
ncbi:MAG: hypothetical protein IJ062_02055 [Firmicutes bacterium]|nr:hypothetical protein [Bacillota bacterium]